MQDGAHIGANSGDSFDVKRGRMRRLAALLVSVIVLGPLAILAASPAAAHAVLLSTDPSAGSSVASAPQAVRLTFNEHPRGQFSEVHVTGPDGKRRDDGPVQVVDDVVTERLAGTRPAGTYVVDWRVVSADGHVVSGQYRYTAKAPASALAAAALPAQTPKSSGGNSGAVIAAIVAAVIILVGGVAGFTFRRRRSGMQK
jgi:methionine-rich copper-binding protein CopC